MKNIIYLFIISIVVLMSSCSPKILNTKDIRYMTLRFEPLTRKDFTLVGNLEATSTITGKIKGSKKTLDSEFSSAYKKGLITTTEATEIMYFAPNKNEVITGSLYENEIFNSIYIPGGGLKSKLGFLAKLMAKFKALKSAAIQDPATDFAYYTLVEKYPDVDYFINVRFERKLTITGKKFTEIVTVKADGVKLRTN